MGVLGFGPIKNTWYLANEILTTTRTVLINSLKMTTSAGLGKVLTSDANGVLTLQNVPAGTVPVSGTSRTAVLAGDAANSWATKEIGQVAAHLLTPKANAQGVAMTKAASGSSGITISDNDQIDFGTGNFALVWRGSLPDWTPTTSVTLLTKKQDGSNRFSLYVSATALGYLHSKTGGVSVSVTTSSTQTVADGSTHEIVCVVTRETASVAGSAAFYIDGALFQSVAIPAGVPADISNTGSFYVAGTEAVREASTTHMAALLNFAPTAAEVKQVFDTGIPESWKWGSQTSVTNKEFSTDVAGYTVSNLTATRVDSSTDPGASSGGTDDWCAKLTASAASSRIFYKAVNTKAGRRVYFTGKYYSATGQPNAQILGYDGVTFPAATLTVGNLTTKDAWTSIAGYFLAANTSAGYCSFGIANGSAGDIIYWDALDVWREGATAAYLPEGVQPAPGQWLDSSTNKLHAMQPATGSALVRPQRTFEVRWTNTWAGTHEAQYIGGVNQNVLPADAFIEYIIGEISGATIEDIIIGDGSDTDRWVAATTGLAAGTTSFTLANRISDGTNKKLVVDPDANFTGSIVFTIKGFILE